MIDLHEILKAIDAQPLLQEAVDKGSIPGLREAVLAGTPVPAQLPAATLTDDEFLEDFVVPWLAERLRAGETLSSIRADYQRCTGTWDWRSATHLPPIITLGYLALDDSDVRDVPAYDDDALCALVAVRRSGGEYEFESEVLYFGDFTCPRAVVSELRRFADFLETLGPTLCLRCLNLDRELLLGPVITHIRASAKGLKKSLSRPSL